MEKAPPPNLMYGMSNPDALPDDVRTVIDKRFLWHDGHKGDFDLYSLNDGRFLRISTTAGVNQPHLTALMVWDVIESDDAHAQRRADTKDETMEGKYGRASYEYEDHEEIDEESED